MNVALTRTYAVVTSQALDLAFGEEEEERLRA